MNNIVDLLLKIDAGEVKMPVSEHKMYCKKLKQKFVFPIRAIDPELVSEISEEAVDMTGGTVNSVSTYSLKTNTILKGCETFKSKELMKHFNATTPIELIRILLLSGEIDSLYEAISDLNSMQKEDKIDEIKN